jgi:hypothetical protein
MHWLCLIAVRKVLALLSDTRTLLLLISYKEHEAVGSACRTTANPVALGKCNLWLRISVCDDIIAFGQHAVCRYVVSRSFALLTPIAEVQSCAGVTCPCAGRAIRGPDLRRSASLNRHKEIWSDCGNGHV